MSTSTSSTATTTPTPTATSSPTLVTGAIVGIAIGAVVGVLILGFCIFYLRSPGFNKWYNDKFKTKKEVSGQPTGEDAGVQGDGDGDVS